MKELLISFVILVFSLNQIQAQNWQPINKLDKYNWQIDTADFITNTIWADSVEIIEEDSVFYLNRIMTDCDTCSNNENDYYALKNQPQFLMRKMIKESDSTYIFQDTVEFIIKPLLHFGEQWTFDSENNIQAVVSFEGEDEIFGSTDSVKNINLSNGKSFIISKNFGILQFPFNNDINYNLTGIEGSREIGEQVPNFWNFFDYDVGDIFQRSEYAGENLDSYDDIYKYEIISKNKYQDSVIYQVEGWHMSLVTLDAMYTDTSCSRFNRSEKYIDSANHFTNHYNHELINIKNCFDENSPIFEDVYNKLIISKIDGLHAKEVGGRENDYPYENYLPSSEHPDLLERNANDIIFLSYRTITGLLSSLIQNMAWEGKAFHGYIHNGDTIGFVYPDEFFEQYSDINRLSENKINIYPNPANDIIYIDFLPSDIEDAQVSFYDITGKEVLSKQFNINEKKIDISELKSGVYFIKINTENQIYISKLIKN
ncbi:MAG: T9SS type A sorting domain-containing protein [Bacteroidales bacterium]|nr:T9SS type A sorting domain-containing protein [Bacteroidales bacterium]